MITQQHTEEDLSRAYITAVCAKAGFNVDITRNHDYKVDGTVHEVTYFQGVMYETGLAIDFQAKSSTNWIERDNSIHYDLDATTYNFLCNRANNKGAAPIILIFLALPKDPSAWLSVNSEELILKKACYWKYLTGEPVSNKETKRVSFSLDHLFDPTSIQKLFDTLKQQGELYDE